MLWILRRVGISLALVWVVASIVFMALHLVPGDPAELLLSTGGVSPDPAAVAELRERLGLDLPLMTQYGSFLAGLLRGDLGSSLVDDYPVAQEIALRLPRTLELILAGTLLAVVFGMPAGTWAALHRGGARVCVAGVVLLDRGRGRGAAGGRRAQAQAAEWQERRPEKAGPG